MNSYDILTNSPTGGLDTRIQKASSCDEALRDATYGPHSDLRTQILAAHGPLESTGFAYYFISTLLEPMKSARNYYGREGELPEQHIVADLTRDCVRFMRWIESNIDLDQLFDQGVLGYDIQADLLPALDRAKISFIGLSFDERQCRAIAHELGWPVKRQDQA